MLDTVLLCELRINKNMTQLLSFLSRIVLLEFEKLNCPTLQKAVKLWFCSRVLLHKNTKDQIPKQRKYNHIFPCVPLDKDTAKTLKQGWKILPQIGCGNYLHVHS